MKIVSKSTDLLEFEYSSWSQSLSGIALFLFFSTGVLLGGEKQAHAQFLGTFFVAIIALAALAVMETSRIVFDRQSGTVRMFRKTAFGTKRLELPLSGLVGVLPEVAHYNKGWWRRPALIFSDDDETWLIPATRKASRRLLVELADEINAWLGSSTEQATHAAGTLIRDGWPPDVMMLDRMIRRLIGRN